jgi:hypothetical protein
MFVDEKRQGELTVVQEDWIVAALEKARTILASHWVGHPPWWPEANMDGPHCAVTAICHCFPVFEQYNTDKPNVVCSYLDKFLGFTCPGAISEWNDTPGRTKEQVLEAFTGAIAIRMAELS